ncbi:MAG: ABC transporter permease, partial [Oscillospiraceae bacterium]|nr:ABC transporter permease [Oscillospiraceae bacterium]
MKRGFYPKLAVSGISKNRKFYIPYILTCAGMVMMFYIVSFLSQSHTVEKMRGGSIIQETLTLGCIIIAVFSLLLLFYTNSFLLKRRKKEFGLYNILGMGKHNIAKVILWENIIIFLISLAGGLFCGILFSKAAELLIMKILRSPVNFGIVIEPIAVVTTAVVYALIFFLILLNSLVQIYRLDPVNLLKSEAVGEKPPKTNW